MAIVNEFFCGFPLKTGSIFIGAYSLIGSLSTAIVLLVVVVGLPKYHPGITQDVVYASILKFVTEYQIVLSITSALFFMEAICAACLLLGALLEKAILLLLWVIQHSVLAILLLLMQIIIAIGLWKIVFQEHTDIDDSLNYTVVVFAIPNTFFDVLLTVYFLVVVYSYYQTLRENQRAN